MKTVPVICVDGPSGVGKGTLSLQLADSLGWHLLDSGALYRVLSLACSQSAVPLDDAPEVAAVARSLDVRFQSGATVSESGWATVM